MRTGVAVVGAAITQTPPKQSDARAARDKSAAAEAAKAASAAASDAAAYAERLATTRTPCHGPSGRSEQMGVPVLAGQHSFYAITQLFLFREGRRDNTGMNAVAKALTDADLRGFCHDADFAGGQQVPRIAGQREEYLRETLHGFHSGKRPGYTQAMIGALATLPPGDLEILAHSAAHLPTALPSARRASSGPASTGVDARSGPTPLQLQAAARVMAQQAETSRANVSPACG